MSDDINIGGRIATKTLFKQYNPDAHYDLDVWYATFVEAEDITEYAPAIQLAGSWTEWNRIKRDWPTFGKMVDQWIEEVEVRIRSKSLKSLCSKVDDTGAMKFIAQGLYKDKLRGRPSKAEVAREARVIAQIDNEAEDEINRVKQAIH